MIPPNALNDFFQNLPNFQAPSLHLTYATPIVPVVQLPDYRPVTLTAESLGTQYNDFLAGSLPPTVFASFGPQTSAVTYMALPLASQSPEGLLEDLLKIQAQTTVQVNDVPNLEAVDNAANPIAVGQYWLVNGLITKLDTRSDIPIIGIQLDIQKRTTVTFNATNLPSGVSASGIMTDQELIQYLNNLTNQGALIEPGSISVNTQYTPKWTFILQPGIPQTQVAYFPHEIKYMNPITSTILTPTDFTAIIEGYNLLTPQSPFKIFDADQLIRLWAGEADYRANTQGLQAIILAADDQLRKSVPSTPYIIPEPVSTVYAQIPPEDVAALTPSWYNKILEQAMQSFEDSIRGKVVEVYQLSTGISVVQVASNGQMQTGSLCDLYPATSVVQNVQTSCQELPAVKQIQVYVPTEYTGVITIESLGLPADIAALVSITSPQ